MISTDVLKLRMNEFGFSRIAFLGSDKDVFPKRIHIVKWINTEPIEVYSVQERMYVERNSYCYAIGELEWDAHEECWEFKSIGMRYLEDATAELNAWILQFCNKYIINGQGEIEEKRDEKN